ncbi:uncharacterized protein DSM5745_02138 [Aspergillus mulundensis]|uniref:Restriction endonuclease type IV Mrr domain-containing protein n=1 Tax=Aspergillus mulundensis TaxID=1810919 RepID=A0A3D8SVL8_9EURO|nr:hypothetical protein DSM5745_02138 [Aspergillus mulundensis]RDW90363.1 hypothetical protein DSM5745_02138 [Aspergillus mulundensis]
MHPTRPFLSIALPSSPPAQLATRSSVTPLNRRLFGLPTPPAPLTSLHNDLPSFLDYARRTSLPEKTTTYQGTIYEYTVQSHLRASAFSLHRVGGKSDLGIDLTGTWHVGANPVIDPPVRVIVQCKATKAKLGPHVVRELEGVTARHFAVSLARGSGGGVGMLVGPRETSKGVREALGRSAMPLVWMMVERDGRVRQVLWNGRVEKLGLGGLGVEVLYSKSGEGEAEAEVSTEARLTWEGKEVQTMDEVEEGMKRLEEEWMTKWKEDGLEDVSAEEVLDAVEKFVPETRPISISDEERKEVARSLLLTRSGRVQ